MEQPIGRHRSLLVLCSVLSLIAGGIIGFFTPHPRTRLVTVITPDPTATPLPTPTPAPLRVYVCGAVAAPAVYRLPLGSLVEDALRAAGGPTSEADLERINLAQELADQQQVCVPRRGEEQSSGPAPSEVSALGVAVVNINTATAAELETLPHIGPTTAQNIISYRETHGPFGTIEEIMEVPGIGAAVFEEIRNRIVVQ